MGKPTTPAGHRLRGGQCLSLADYVTMRGPNGSGARHRRVLELPTLKKPVLVTVPSVHPEVAAALSGES